MLRQQPQEGQQQGGIGQTIVAPERGLQEMQHAQRTRAQQLAGLHETAPTFRPNAATLANNPRVAPLPPQILRAQQLAAQTGLAQPFLQEARRIAESRETFPTALRQYMNPYTQNVVNAIAREGNENLERNIIPALDAKFAKLGQFGSSRHQQELARLSRDVQRDISNQQQKALFTGYHHAGELFGADTARAIERADLLGKLGALTQTGNLEDVKQLSEIGNYARQQEQMVRDAAYQDWVRQNMYQWDILSRWIAATQGIPSAMTTTEFATTPQAPTLNTAGSAALMAAAALPILSQQRQAAQQNAILNRGAANFISSGR